jgi:hypothetical protein
VILGSLRAPVSPSGKPRSLWCSGHRRATASVKMRTTSPSNRAPRTRRRPRGARPQSSQCKRAKLHTRMALDFLRDAGFDPPAMKVFVSYSHKQGEWVWDRLRPCLAAAGATQIIDRERFRAGLAVYSQMDAAQDAADKTLVVLSPDYLASDACLHEMRRAVARDPRFTLGTVIPLKRLDCTLPPELAGPNPLWVDLRDDRERGPWDQLLRACAADLGCPAPAWLQTRNRVAELVGDGRSLNLVVRGNPRWRELIDHVRTDKTDDLAVVDLQDPRTTSRRGLVEAVLSACGRPQRVPESPEDLVCLGQVLSSRSAPVRLALTHFDLASVRPYGLDLFSTLLFLTNERKLALCIQSRRPFIELLPAGHPLSQLTNCELVELAGHS